MTTTIVSASNDNFLPLAKGLWRSILDLGLKAHFDLAWIDIGDSDRTRVWLGDSAPAVRQLAVPEAISTAPTGAADMTYHRAQVVRPLLPELLPDSHVILWVDSDIWIQDPATIWLFEAAVMQSPDSFALAPIHDVAYSALFTSAREFADESVVPVWKHLYGEDVARRLEHHPIFSSGLFCAAADNDLWHRWGAELDRLWSMRSSIEPKYLHVAEQTALTKVLYESGRFIALEAIHNFHANLGQLVRNPSGQVTTLPPASRKIGAVHLSDLGNSDLAQQYLDRKLFYTHDPTTDANDIESLLPFRRN